jgi:DNA-binding transcriptional ArsR family regulator
MDSLLGALAAPRRLEIVRLLWEGEEKSAGDIHRALGRVSFGAVSQHLGVLTRCGVLGARADGRHRYYRVRHERLGALVEWLPSMWNEALARLKLRAELEESRRGPRPARTRRRR